MKHAVFLGIHFIAWDTLHLLFNAARLCIFLAQCTLAMRCAACLSHLRLPMLHGGMPLVKLVIPIQSQMKNPVQVEKAVYLKSASAAGLCAPQALPASAGLPHCPHSKPWALSRSRCGQQTWYSRGCVSSGLEHLHNHYQALACCRCY